MTLTSLVAVQSNIHPGPNSPGQVNSLLDRGHGRPRQEVDVTQNNGVRVIVYGEPSPGLGAQLAIEDHAQEEV
jgi:hypothetical protein